MDNLHQAQRTVIAAAIAAAEQVIARLERDHGPHPDPTRRVHAIARVVEHVLNAYAAEHHLDWTRHDWYDHQATTALAAITANDHQLVHELVAEVVPTRWDPDTNTHVWA